MTERCQFNQYGVMLVHPDVKAKDGHAFILHQRELPMDDDRRSIAAG